MPILKTKPPVSQLQEIPVELRSRRQWVCWKIESRDGKPTKVPVNPNSPSKNAGSTLPATWGTFDEAVKSCAENGLSGIGFVFTTEDEYCGIDLDKCRNPKTGTFEPWAKEIIDSIDSYTEISQSKTGCHIIVKGKVPGSRNRKGRFEAYDRDRYFIFTGDHVTGTPASIHPRQNQLNNIYGKIFREDCKPGTNGNGHRSSLGLDDQQLLDKAMAARNGATFSRLWNGETDGHTSASEADLSLCNALAFWCGGDPVRIDNLFRQSGLYRAKWDKRHGAQTYGELTVSKALESSGDYYGGNGNGAHSGAGFNEGDESEKGKPAAAKTEEWAEVGGTAQAFGQRLSTEAEAYDTKTAEPAMHASSPFPFEDLPTIFREMAEELSAALPIAKELVACAGLAAAAGAIGRSRMIQVKPGWNEPTNLWMALVNPPGQMKTPSLTQMVAPIHKLQRDAAETYRLEKSQHEDEIEVYEAARSQYRNKKLDELPPKPSRPVMKRFSTVDVTVEKLSVLLDENPRGILVVRDELTGWVKAFNQYKGGKGADKSFWLSAWAGAPHTVDRQGKDPIFIEHPTVSVVGNIPPTILGELNADSEDDGFLHRILFCNPDPIKVRWSDQAVSEKTRQEYHKELETLSALGMRTTMGDDGTEREEPKVLPLDCEAQRLYVEWHDDHYRKTEDIKFNHSLGGFHHKLKGYCARFALIHQLLTNPDSEVVSKQSIGFGCDLADYFAGQAASVFPELAKVKVTPQSRCENAIQRALANHGAMTKRELQRNCNASAMVFNPVLDSLIALGSVRELNGRFELVID